MGSATLANTKISGVDGSAFIDLNDAAIFAAHIAKHSRLFIIDSAGKRISGYIKAAGTGETYGSNILNNGDMETGDPPTNWGGARLTPSRSTDVHGGTYALKETLTASNGYYTNYTLSPVSQALYKVGIWAKNITSTSITMAMNSATYPGHKTIGSTSSLTYAEITSHWTAQGAYIVTGYFYGAIGAYGLIDDAYVKQILTPSATGVTITSTPGGSTYNWASKDSSFNYNDANGYTYVIVPATCNFNYNFITEKNKRTSGPTPINLLTFGFSTPVYLSDRDVTPSGGSAHLGLIKSWGFIDSSIQQTPGSGILGSIEIADLELTIINSTSPRFSDNFTAADPPENVTVTLYQWFSGLLDSEKEIIFKGIIYGQPKYTEYTCTLTVRGIFQKYNRKIGEDKIITPADYPDADPDTYGMMGNIVYGEVDGVPCLAVESGDVNSLVADITAAQTSIELSDASYFPSSGTIGIDAEQITYTGISGNTLTGCTRGANSTTATTHLSGAAAWEERSQFVYQIACHPVKTIGDIYCDGVKITSVCTKYTGQTGSELTGYAGQAVFTVPARLTRKAAIDLLIDDGMTINDAISVVDSIEVTDGISISDTIGVSEGSHAHSSGSTIVVWKFESCTVVSGTWTDPSNVIDGNLASYADQAYGSSWCYLTLGKVYYEDFPGTPTRIRTCLRIKQSGANSDNRQTLSFCGAALTVAVYNFTDQTFKSAWTNVGTSYDTWAEINAATASLGEYHRSSLTTQIYEAWAEIEYTPNTNSSAASGVAKSGTVSRSGAVVKTGAAAKDGTVTREGAITLSGNSIADVRIGKVLTSNIEGYQDDSSGTYTGTPNALIERPDHVFKHIWAVLLGASLSDVNAASFTAAGTFYAANSYAFATMIGEPIQASELMMRLALQCRSRFLVTPAGVAFLNVRQLDQTSLHSIISSEIKRDSMLIERSPTDEIFNLFYVSCDLDVTKSASDPLSYKHNIKFTDATSVSRYGTREWLGGADMFCFDAVKDPNMAQDVGEFLLAYHCRARNILTFGVFLDNLEVDPGHIIDVTHTLDSMSGFACETLKTNHHLGNIKQIDWKEIVAVDNAT